jgi:hypothetical protein
LRRNLLVAALLLAAVLGAVKYTVDLSRERNAALLARDEADKRRGLAEGLISFMVGDLYTNLSAVDPLVCTRCGQKMQPIAFLTDQLSIRRILDHLGLGTSAQDKPPPAREILRVAEQGEAWGVPANWE